MEYPRPIRPKELDLLETVLPLDRPGYRTYRDRLESMVVLGEGKRGEGDLVLGSPGDRPDISSPLSPVIAYGVLETTQGSYTITVREEAWTQMNVEIVSGGGGPVPDHYEEKRRWTYSWWSPGKVSPATGTSVRELAVDADVTLAFSPVEKRLWIHERSSGCVRLIPVTDYFTELMTRRRERDPRIALVPSLLWEGLKQYSDQELREAFVAYNSFRRHVTLHPESAAARRAGIPLFIRNLFKRKT